MTRTLNTKRPNQVLKDMMVPKLKQLELKTADSIEQCTLMEETNRFLTSQSQNQKVCNLRDGGVRHRVALISTPVPI